MSEPTETQLAASIAENHGDDRWRYEVPYNHYGDRGVVDLVGENERDGEPNTLHVLELKSDAALREMTGANEILRQFNRHREYFIDGTDYNPRDYTDVVFELAFAATPSCIEHVTENWSVYDTVHMNRRGSTRSLNVRSSVFIRHADESAPIHVDDSGIIETVGSKRQGLVEADR